MDYVREEKRMFTNALTWFINMKCWITTILLGYYGFFFKLEKIGKKYGAGLLKIQRYDFENLKFPDFNTFSDEDIALLKREAKLLSFGNSTSAVDNITKIISKYSNVNHIKIKQLYEDAKHLRLECA